MADDTSKVASAFLLGGLVGAFIAILYAPKPGRQTRKDIAKATSRVKGNIADIADDTVKRVNEFVGDMKERAEDIVEKGFGLSETAKKEVVKALEQSQKAIEKQKKRILEGLGL